MNIEDIEPGDILYINHHVAEPKEVDPDTAAEPTVDFSERSAQVVVDKIHEDEGIVVVSDNTSDKTRQWILEPGHLLQGGVPDANDE